jgi:predicted metal-binding protein
MIPFDEGLRSYCEMNYCGSYGKNFACPPDVGSSNDVIKKAKTYDSALVFQSVFTIQDSFDFEGMTEAADVHSKTARKICDIISKEYDDFLQLTVGACDICSTCTKSEGKPCRFPQRAVSSLEAYCINVSVLAPLCGMQYINGKDTVTYFGAFLIK